MSNKPDVTVITCTGGRPLAWSLCVKSMASQDFKGRIQWIIVDDVIPTSMVPVLDSRFEVAIIQPTPTWAPGDNTLSRNLLAALPKIKSDVIVFYEDDDYYGPEYLTHAVGYVSSVTPAAIQIPTLYYNLRTRSWRAMPEGRALFQTAIHKSVLGDFEFACGFARTSPDLSFTRIMQQKPHGVAHWSAMSVASSVMGVKGLPGRPGIGVGHRPGVGWAHDPEGLWLARMVGVDAFMRYNDIMRDLDRVLVQGVA